MSKVLVVEDEPAIAESIAYVLEKSGHEARIAADLGRAREELQQPTELIILDLMLPDGSGFDLIAEFAERRNVAIIVLSSRDGEVDRVRALEMGADDYVVKPFSPREVAARAKAVLRRSQVSPPMPLTVSKETRRALLRGTPLDLTRVEFDLLELLLGEPGKVFSRPDIIDRVWGSGFALSDRTIDSHIKALRKKLHDAGGQPTWIETVRGVGYRLLEPEALDEEADQ